MLMIMESLNSFLKDVNDLQSFGSYLETVSMFPIFQISHLILIAVALRSRSGSHEFAKVHPLSSWFVCITSCYGGSIIQNVLLAQPIMIVLKDERNFVVGSLIWYLVFFSPADIVWKILEFKISRALLRVLKEVHRVRMIQNGIALAAKLHPGSWLIIIIIGAIRGSGAKFLMKPLDHIVRGELISSNELLQPHFATKSALLVSALLYSEVFAGFNITRQVMVIFVIAYLVLFQVAFIFTSIEDPYLKVEKILSYAFMKLPQELFSKHDKKSKTD